MGKIYLKFKHTKATKGVVNKPKSWFNNFFKNSIYILTSVIPKANPDYDDKIDEVDYWLVEVDDYAETADREIGVNNKEQTIMIMPFGRNYGYWTDNGFELSDFIESLNATMVTPKEFNYRWERFEDGRIT